MLNQRLQLKIEGLILAKKENVNNLHVPAINENVDNLHIPEIKFIK